MNRTLIICAALALAACEPKIPDSTIYRVEPPEALLTCKKAPAPPVEAEKQSEVASYIVRLHSAGQDCRDKLGAVRDFVIKGRPGR